MREEGTGQRGAESEPQMRRNGFQVKNGKLTEPVDLFDDPVSKLRRSPFMGERVVDPRNHILSEGALRIQC